MQTQKFLNMKHLLCHALLVATLTLGLCACDSNDPNGPGQEEKLSYVAININDSTQDADILFACSDGSYMLCDVNNENGYGVIYLNSSPKKAMEEGIFIFIDSTGTPAYVKTKEGEIVFNNANDLSCNMACRNNAGETTYFWEAQLFETSVTAYGPNRIKANWSDAATSPLRKWWDEVHNFDWTWDEHQRRAILPYLAKVTAFGMMAVGIWLEPIEAVSGVITLYEEAAKSGLLPDDGVIYCEAYELGKTALDANDVRKLWKSDNFKFEAGQFSLGLWAGLLNQFADEWLEHVGDYKEQTDAYFSNPAARIVLSKYVVEQDYDGGYEAITVSAYGDWEVLDYKSDWCFVSKDNQDPSLLDVKVYKNEDDEDRTCNVILRLLSANGPSTTLTIRQAALKLEVSETDLLFEEKSDSKKIKIEVGAQVKSWSVVDKPDWLNADESRFSLTLSVNSKHYPSSEQSGVVLLKAYLNDGSTLTRTINVRIVPIPEGSSKWDNTRWIFTGPFVFNDGSGGTLGMELVVNSVSAHSATMTIMNTPNIPCKVSEDSSHQLNGTFAIPDAGVSGSFTVTRNENSATCTITIKVPDGGVGTGTLVGTLQ